MKRGDLMVRFRQKLDRNMKIYIPKSLREIGFKDVLEIRPDTHAAATYPEGTDVSKIIRSLELIIQDLKLEISDE